ncbi:MAG: LysR family transcriptional regulator [Pseudomonadota bacterium]
MPLVDHLKSLRAACAVSLTGSSMGAAQALHLSQSSVTRAVQLLEDALQQVVFDRSARGMTVTPPWAELLQRCVRAFECLAVTPATKVGTLPGQGWLACRFASGVSLRHVRVLMSLAATGSETVSAAQLGVSQSAVHQSLVQLEHFSGKKLFTRSRQHGLRLTEWGVQVRRGCKLFLSELAQADEVLAALSGQVAGRLVIGTLPFSVGPLLTVAVHRVLLVLPGLQVTVVDGTYDALIEQLRDAEIDLIVGALRPEFAMQGLEQETLFVDGLAVVARTGHPLALKKKLTWQHLADASWVMPMPNTPAQKVFERTLARGGLPLPDVPLRVNSSLMMQSLLLQSDRLAMMSPRQIQSEIQAGLLVVLPLAVPEAVRTIGLIRRSGMLLTPGMQAVLQACRQAASERVGENPLNKPNA